MDSLPRSSLSNVGVSGFCPLSSSLVPVDCLSQLLPGCLHITVFSLLTDLLPALKFIESFSYNTCLDTLTTEWDDFNTKLSREVLLTKDSSVVWAKGTNISMN